MDLKSADKITEELIQSVQRSSASNTKPARSASAKTRCCFMKDVVDNNGPNRFAKAIVDDAEVNHDMAETWYKYI